MNEDQVTIGTSKERKPTKKERMDGIVHGLVDVLDHLHTLHLDTGDMCEHRRTAGMVIVGQLRYRAIDETVRQLLVCSANDATE